MAVELKKIIEMLERVLQPGRFSDYCPNGLQVQGRSSVKKIVTGVTASQLLIERAVDAQADAILVHHGYFWRGEAPELVGVKYQRIKRLIDSGVSLIAYHLPLDAHPVLGNNAQLAKLLGVTVEGALSPLDAQSVGNVGRLPAPVSLAQFARHIELKLGRQPLVIDAGDHRVSRIGWCTGAAQGYIGDAAAAGVDVYLSGEISEPTVHLARELGVHYVAAGHHATERYGVMALGGYLAEELGVDHEFIDVENPV